MFIVYGAHSGYKDNLQYLLFNDNFMYQSIFQVLYREKSNYVLDLLKKYGKYDELGYYICIDRNGCRKIYEELEEINREEPLYKSLDMRKKILYNDSYYLYMIVDFY